MNNDMKSWKRFSAYGALLSVAAVSSLSSFWLGEAQDAIPATLLPPEVEVSTLPAVLDAMTLPHYAKIGGIHGAIVEGGGDISDTLELKLLFAARLVELKAVSYSDNPLFSEAMKLAAEEGAIEARAKAWTPGQLESYVDQVMEVDTLISHAFDMTRAHMLDEGIGAEDAEAYIRRSATLSLRDFLTGDARPAGADPRIGVEETGHAGVVQDVHDRLYEFLQERMAMMTSLDAPFFHVEAEGPFTIEPGDSVLEGDEPDQGL